MHSGQYRPVRANWIWLTTAGLTVAAAGAVAAFQFAQPAGCPAAPAPGARLSLISGPPLGLRGGRTGAALALPAGVSRAGAGVSPVGARPSRAGAGASPHRRPGQPGFLYSGHALFYDPGSAAGSCALGPLPGQGWYASLSPRQFAHGRTCGTYLDVRGPAGTVRAEVVDLCPTCARTTINLSRSAFDRIGDPRPGSVPVTYRWVADPPPRQPLALRVTGLGPGEVAVQVIGNGNRLMSVAIARSGVTAAGWQQLQPDGHGSWLSWALPVPGPYAIRIADILGHRVTLPRVPLTPGTLVRTSSRLYRPGGAAQTPVAARTRPALPRATTTAGCT